MDVNDSNQQQLDQRNVTSRSKKKCHGNRRDQRFRKRCRARKMKPSTITKLLQRRKRIRTTTIISTSTNNNSSDNNHNYTKKQATQITNNSNTETLLPLSTTIINDGSTQICMAPRKQITSTTDSHKRKRNSSCQELKINQIMTKSTSSTSITQSLSKRIKTKTKSITNLSIKVTNKIINKNYRFVFSF